MRIYAIDLFAQSADKSPTRTVQVPAASVDEALQKARKTMDTHETALRHNSAQPTKPVRALDIKV
jgi:hypothetical protein